MKPVAPNASPRLVRSTGSRACAGTWSRSGRIASRATRIFAVTPGHAQNAPAAPWSGRFENGAAESSGDSAHPGRRQQFLRYEAGCSGTLHFAEVGVQVRGHQPEVQAVADGLSRGRMPDRPAPVWQGHPGDCPGQRVGLADGDRGGLGASERPSVRASERPSVRASERPSVRASKDAAATLGCLPHTRKDAPVVPGCGYRLSD